MRLVGPDRQSLELRICGYQFPACETDDYDSNWLIVEGTVAHPRGEWAFRDPCLLTYEASRLADWLESLSRSDPSSKEESFIEPNLSFRKVESPTGCRLRVYFELESRPSWAASNSAGEEDLWVEFPINELDMRRAAIALQEQLQIYPQRAPR
jgi:hypothetical protein